MTTLTLRALLTAVALAASLGASTDPRANCLSPPPGPTDCFCGHPVWGDIGQLDVVYIGRITTTRVAERRVEWIKVESVFTADGASAEHGPGDILVLRSQELSSSVDDDAPDYSLRDAYRSLVWPLGGGYGRLPVPDEGLVSFIPGGEDWTDYEGEPICATPVAPEVVAAAVVDRRCAEVIRELAPQVPARTPYACNDNDGGPLCAGGTAPPWWPAAGATVLLAALLRRRRRRA